MQLCEASKEARRNAIFHTLEGPEFEGGNVKVNHENMQLIFLQLSPMRFSFDVQTAVRQ